MKHITLAKRMTLVQGHTLEPNAVTYYANLACCICLSSNKFMSLQTDYIKQHLIIIELFCM